MVHGPWGGVAEEKGKIVIKEKKATFDLLPEGKDALLFQARLNPV